VADSHYGAAASKSLIAALEGLPEIRTIENVSKSLCQAFERSAPSAPSEAALVIAKVDLEARQVHVESWADAAIYLIDAEQVLGPLNDPSHDFIGGAQNRFFYLAKARAAIFDLPPGPGLLLLCTDGVFECCYRQPQRSIQNAHLLALAARVGLDPKIYADALLELALQGVDGNPGGEDNIAIIALAF
jgi:hypothetical protein